MSKLKKFTKAFGITAAIIFAVSLVLGTLLNLLFPLFEKSTVAYWEFIYGLPEFFSAFDYVALLSYSFLAFGVLLAIVWLVLMLIKKKFIVFLYFIFDLAVFVVFSYCLFMFVGEDSYFVAAIKSANDNIGNLIMLVALLFTSSLSVCFIITFAVLSIISAFKDAKKRPVKVNKNDVNEAKDLMKVEEKDGNKRILVVVKRKTVEPKVIKETITEEVKVANTAEEEPNALTKEDVKQETSKVGNNETVKEGSEEVKGATIEVKKSGKVYHISQHPTEDKWQVKLAKGEKAIKLFDTQLEAIEYAKELSKNQGGSIRLHARDGKIRKI